MQYESPCRGLFHGPLQPVKSIDIKLNVDEAGPSTSQIVPSAEIEVLSDDSNIYDESKMNGMISHGCNID